MQETINRLRAKKGDEGFTLIELLVVVVIIGVLVAIAVPVYLNYRKGAADKSAQSDIRGAISAIEQYYTENNNTYPPTAAGNNTGASGTESITLGGATGTQKITLSDKTQLGYNLTTPATGAPYYTICAHSTGGTEGRWYVYNSTVGGSVKVSSVTTPSQTNC